MAACYGAEVPQDMKWIDINEQKPHMYPAFHEPKEMLIVARSDGKVQVSTYCGLGFSNLNSRDVDVTHWMPMPKHPNTDFPLAHKLSEAKSLWSVWLCWF